MGSVECMRRPPCYYNGGICPSVTTMHIALLVDNKIIEMTASLEQAKKLAEPYIVENRQIGIEHRESYTERPAPIQIWIYDYDVRDWVEQK